MRERVIRCMHAAAERGFTLIEMIVSIVLIAVIATVAGLGLVKLVNGYISTAQTTATIQGAQIAMARIVRELGMATSINSITTTNPASVNYTRWKNDSDQLPADEVTNTIALSGTALQINSASQPLIQNVASFTLACCDAQGNTTTTPANIQWIYVKFTLSGGPTFTNSVNLMETY